MHDASLHPGLGENRRDRLRKSFQPVDYGDQDVLDSAMSELVHHRQPELGSFSLLDPEPQYILGAIALDP
jgi:hypothetical protein